eukprot:699182-Pelagomonas_calceolata.AAC.6
MSETSDLLVFSSAFQLFFYVGEACPLRIPCAHNCRLKKAEAERVMDAEKAAKREKKEAKWVPNLCSVVGAPESVPRSQCFTVCARYSVHQNLCSIVCAPVSVHQSLCLVVSAPESVLGSQCSIVRAP